MNEFYDYLSDTDKEFMAIESAHNIDMEKQMLAYEYASKIYDIKVMQSDLKVLTESGTYDDIEFLYSEAGKEAEEKKQNIIVRMIEGVKNLISKLITAISNIFKGKKKQEVDAAVAKAGNIKGVKDPGKTQGIISKAIQDINRLIRPGSEITVDTANRVSKIVKGAGAGLVAVGVGTFTAVKVNKGREEGESALHALTRMMKEFVSRPPKGEGAPTAVKSIGELANHVASSTKEHGAKVWGVISGLFSKKGKNGAEQPEGDAAETEPTEANDQAAETPAAEPNTGGGKEQQPEAAKESTDDVIDEEGMMESEELSQTMDELSDLFASL